MGLPDWAHRVREAIRHDLASADDVDAVFRTMHALGHALQSLYDEQNDAPLETRRAQWERAMRSARNALRMYDEGPGVGNQPDRGGVLRASAVPQRRCRGCGAPIVWIQTKAGKRMPVNVEPYTTVVTDGGEVVRGRTSHFSTCPMADLFRNGIADSRAGVDKHGK